MNKAGVREGRWFVTGTLTLTAVPLTFQATLGASVIPTLLPEDLLELTLLLGAAAIWQLRRAR